jgi:ceramide glucosyltransferase
MTWAAVWKHQLRWARTIRVCQPLPYFFSILTNATLWPLLWALAYPTKTVLSVAGVCWLIRIVTAIDLQKRLTRCRTFDSFGQPPFSYAWLILVKDLLQTTMWFGAFVGNRIEWRGKRMRLRLDGTLEEIQL